MSKESSSKKLMHCNSTRKKRKILESCMIEFLRICSTIYNNDLENPLRERFQDIDPFSFIENAKRLKHALENIHAALTDHEERQIKTHEKKLVKRFAQNRLQ